MFFKKLMGSLIPLSLVTLLGCGDLLGNKKVPTKLDTSRFTASCTLDIDQFGKILHENITPQIRCLGENLNLFINVVVNKKPGYMGRAELEAYLLNNRKKDFTPDMIKALKAVYDINYLITGDDPDYISKKNVDQLIDFALKFNTEASLNFGPTFDNQTYGTSYDLHRSRRDRVTTAAATIARTILPILNTSKTGNVRSLNIINLLNSFTTQENNDSVEKVKKLLFVKKILLGGDKETITNFELAKLFLNLEKFLGVALDGVQYKYIDLDQKGLIDFLQQDVNTFFDIVFNGFNGNRDKENLFSISELKEAAKLLIDQKKLDIDKYDTLLTEAKKIFMGGNDKDVYGADLRKLVQRVQDVLKSGSIFHSLYDNLKLVMENGKPVTMDFSNYYYAYPNGEMDVRKFERIVKKYRFFKGEFISAYYTRNYKRNADAIFQTAIFEYLLTEVFKAYGCASNNTVGGYSMSAAQVTFVVNKFSDVLIDAGLMLPRRGQTTADNISLLGTLFQYQSDTNGLLDVNEATEFFMSLITATSMSSDFLDYYKLKAKEDENCKIDDFSRVNAKCFRNYFFQGICEKYRGYFPLLFESLGMTSENSCAALGVVEEDKNDSDRSFDPTAAAEYLKMSNSAARGCNFYHDGQGNPTLEEIPYSEGDIMTILMVMMHAETTILRWDDPLNGGNSNNIMDPKEVDSAYVVYSPALDGFLATMPSIVKSLKKPIYQYLIKYEQVPDTKKFGSIWAFVKFLASFNKKASATRKTLSAILTAIGEQNAIIHKDDPQFDCNWLRNPNDIPKDPSPPAQAPAPTCTAPTAAVRTYAPLMDLLVGKI